MTKRSVYVVRCLNTSFYKIGQAEHAGRRVATLQPACPLELSLIVEKRYSSVTKALYMEALLHRMFIGVWIRNEWYELSPKDLDKIIRVLTKEKGGKVFISPYATEE